MEKALEWKRPEIKFCDTSSVVLYIMNDMSFTMSFEILRMSDNFFITLLISFASQSRFNHIFLCCF